MILENKMQDVKQIWCWKMNKENKKMQGHKVNMMHKKSATKKNREEEGGAESKILEETEKKKWAQNKKVGLTDQI